MLLRFFAEPFSLAVVVGVLPSAFDYERESLVADRIVVLRLGRNNGVFTADSSNAELVSAITGATENSVSRRQARKLEPTGA